MRTNWYGHSDSLTLGLMGNLCMAIELGYVWSTRIWLLVSRFEPWSPKRPIIVFANQQPFNIVIQGVKDYICCNNTIFLTFIFLFICCSLFFSKVYTCIINKHTKLQSIWGKTHLDFLINKNSQNVFHEKICFDMRFFYAK
jgi:hypothetical protein